MVSTFIKVGSTGVWGEKENGELPGKKRGVDSESTPAVWWKCPVEVS